MLKLSVSVYDNDEVWMNGRKYIPASSLRQPIALSEEQWEALEKAESWLYKGEEGCHAYTDVMEREQDGGFASDVWQQCYIGVDGITDPDLRGDREKFLLQMTARRVARVFAVMSFGEEFLLK